jgi:hypothetical protein
MQVKPPPLQSRRTTFMSARTMRADTEAGNSRLGVQIIAVGQGSGIATPT